MLPIGYRLQQVSWKSLRGVFRKCSTAGFLQKLSFGAKKAGWHSINNGDVLDHVIENGSQYTVTVLK